MFGICRGQYALLALAVLFAESGARAVAAAPDSTLYTNYTVDPKLQNATWLVCGSTAQSEGCYASGSLGPFGRIGAMLESPPEFSGSTVTRQIYVIDVATGNARNGVSLLVYTKKDVVSAASDAVTVALERTIPLPLVGGSTATASMAANGSHLYVGTKQSTQAVSVAKSNWAVTLVGGFSPPLPVASITADNYGYVTITFGAPGGQFSGFYVFGPKGTAQGDGGGAEFMLDSLNAVVPAPLPF
jgi:hypothetical protein